MKPNMKKIGGLLKAGLKKIDLFPTNQFIKFNKQSQYTTATGGLVSLCLIVIILILFSNRGVDTLNRAIINSSISSQVDVEPPPLSIVTSPKGKFMFAIGIFNLNLNDPTETYFDISLYQNYFSPIYNLINSSKVPLVQCTQDHFNFGPDVLEMYNKFTLSYSLCPPLNHKFDVRGRVTSDIFSQIRINIKKCNSTINPTCVNDTLLSSIGTFTLLIPVVNTIVNPNDQQYLQTFIQDRNYFSFTTSNGIAVKAEIAEYEVDTDVSIMPYTDVATDLIPTVPNLFTVSSAPVGSNGVFADIAFSKSSTTTTYTRSFSKIDDYFSYIGGLLGSFLVLFFMLKSYSERSFLIDIAEAILENNRPEISLKRFNFMDNIGIICKKALDFIHIDIGWQNGGFLIQTMQQMEEQLDICLLIRKITFLEEAVSSILSEHQLDTLYLKDKRSIEMIKKWRQKHKIAKNIQHIQNQQRTDLSLKSQEIISEQLNSTQNKQLLDKVKSNVQTVIHESNNQNKISRRIIEKLDGNKLQKFGLLQVEEAKIVQLRQRRASGDLSCEGHSINAIHNQFQQVKSKREGKQDLVFQYIQS